MSQDIRCYHLNIFRRDKIATAQPGIGARASIQRHGRPGTGAVLNQAGNILVDTLLMKKRAFAVHTPGDAAEGQN